MFSVFLPILIGKNGENIKNSKNILAFLLFLILGAKLLKSSGGEIINNLFCYILHFIIGHLGNVVLFII